MTASNPQDIKQFQSLRTRNVQRDQGDATWKTNQKVTILASNQKYNLLSNSESSENE